MNALITGGGGFLGQRLAKALLARDAGAGVTLVDIAFPPGVDSRCKCVTGDLGSAEVLARALAPGTTSIFHLAAVVSGAAEADFDLGYRVNLDATRALLEACRRLPQPPRLVFASSVAAFGGTMPEVIDDATTPTPQSSYGVQKVIGEYLVGDYSRKGFIDGRALRLPTIVVRPGKPNLAASSFASGILREPLNGAPSDCPVPDSTGVWILSPRKVIESILHGHDLPAQDWGTRRVLNLPGITVSVRQMIAALRKVAGDEVASRIAFRPDARIQAIVSGWPSRFRTERAAAMGFQADDGIEAIIRDYLADEGVKI
jgi:nucleoside-diphosphate-sugar epimerase